MQRGRELRKQGITGDSLFNERDKEVKAGTLQMPKRPAALYVYSAKDEEYDRSTGEVKNGYLRYVIYIRMQQPRVQVYPKNYPPTGCRGSWIPEHIRPIL